MATIRRQTIISSLLIYVGFAFGALNTYLFTREGGFTKDQYGLTGIFMAIATVMMSVATLGMPAYVNKFYPYYKDHLDKKHKDIFSWALLVAIGGFVLVMIAGFLMKDVIGRVYDNSPDLVVFYYWLFPFGFGLTIFSVLEAIAWQQHRSIVTNYLREVQFRVFVTVLIVLTHVGLISSFDIFIRVYSFIYLFIALMLLAYLMKTGRINFTVKVSKVTRRFFKKILSLSGLVWSGVLIYNLSSVFDTIILAAVLPDGLAIAGLFTFAQYLTSLIQAPQRSIIAASVAHLSQAWKDKDLQKINRIYMRSSINQIIFSCAMFCLIWLNYSDAIITFNMQSDYLVAINVFVFMGLVRIIDMGTGLNGQIIATSIHWRFDFFTGIILLTLSLPLNYFLTQRYGLIGPAVSNLISLTVYNAIRYFFLLKKYNMQPFTSKSLLAVILAATCFLICYFLMNDQTGWLWLVLRSMLFLVLFITGTIVLNLSEDLKPVVISAMRRLGRRKV